MNPKLFLKRHLPKVLVAAIQRERYARKIGRLTVDSDKDFKGIKYIITEGDAVIDIGANMGYFTKYLSSTVGNTGMVYSVEPIPDSYKLLKYVTDKLHLQNIQLFNCAVSNINDVVTMEIPLSDSGEENLFEAKITPTAGTTHSRTLIVSTRTIDSLIPWKEKKISFIKCDVEGHEFECLEGAVSLIENVHPAWLIEIWGNLDQPNSQAKKTEEFMKRFGYQSYIFDGSLFHMRKPGESDINYFFLTDTHVQILRNSNRLQSEN